MCSIGCFWVLSRIRRTAQVFKKSIFFGGLLFSILLSSLCTNSLNVSEAPLNDAKETTTNVSPNDIQTFVGGASATTFVVGGCLDRNNIDVYTAKDLDKDAVADPCDAFILQKEDGNFIYEGNGFYFGYKVWGWKNIYPGFISSSETTFTIYNSHVDFATMDVKIEVTGVDASNFLIYDSTVTKYNKFVNTPVQITGLANGSTSTIKVKLVATDTNEKTASLKITINKAGTTTGDSYLVSLTGSTLICAGSSWHCERRYNQIAMAGTHNSHTSKEDFNGAFSIIGINHNYGIPSQLTYGIRSFMLDWYRDSGRIRNCHKNCVWGWSDAIQKNILVAQFLANNPGEIINYIVEPGAGSLQPTVADIEATLVNGGLWSFIFRWDDPIYLTHYNGGNSLTPNTTQGYAGAVWPYAGWMVENNKRFVFFTEGTTYTGTDSQGNNFMTSPWLLSGAYIYYPGSANNGNLQCNGRSGGTGAATPTWAGDNTVKANTANYYYILAAWETCDSAAEILGKCFSSIGGGVPSVAKTLNSYPSLTNFAKTCWCNKSDPNGATGYNPNKIFPSSFATDFYDLGNGGGLSKNVLEFNKLWVPSSSSDYTTLCAP